MRRASEDGGADGLEPEIGGCFGADRGRGGVEPFGVRQLEGGLGAEGEDVEDGWRMATRPTMRKLCTSSESLGVMGWVGGKNGSTRPRS